MREVNLYSINLDVLQHQHQHLGNNINHIVNRKFLKENTQIFLQDDAGEDGYTRPWVPTPGHHLNCKPVLLLSVFSTKAHPTVCFT